MLLTAAAIATIAGDIVRRFLSRQVSLPLQRTRLSECGGPAVPSIVSGAPAELGALVHPIVAGSILGVRFYRLEGDVGPHIGSLWSRTGQRLAAASFGADATPGWHEVLFAAPVHVSANETLLHLAGRRGRWPRAHCSVARAFRRHWSRSRCTSDHPRRRCSP